MSVTRFLSVVSSVLPAPPVIKPAGALKKSGVPGSIRLLMSGNGCSRKLSHYTIAHKYTCNAKFVDHRYRELLSDSESDIPITKHGLRQKDKIVTPLIQQGQSPHQIAVNHPELDMSVRSIYTCIDKGLFYSRNIDLKRKPKFSPPEMS